MRAILLTLLFLLFHIPGCEEEIDDPVASTDSDRYLVVIGFTTLRLLDLSTGELEPTVFGLGNAPNWAIPDGDRLYVINSLSNDITVFEAADGSIVQTGSFDIGLGLNNNPYAGVLTVDGRLLVTNLMRNTVSVVNPSAREVEEVWQAGTAPEGILTTESVAYVLNTGFDFATLRFRRGSIWTYTLADGLRRHTLETGVNSQFGFLAPDNRLHVICTGDYNNQTGEVRVYQLDPMDEVGRVEFEGYPGRYALAPDGTVYLASGGFEEDGEAHGLVLTYGAATLQAGDSIAVDLGALDVAYDDETDRLYVACKDAVTLSVVTDGEQSRSIPLNDPPQALAIWELE